MHGAEHSSQIDQSEPAVVPARPPVLQVIVEADQGPDIMDALRGRLDKLGCPFPEVSDTADGGLSVSGLLSGLPSRELVPVACRLLGVAGVRKVQASFLSADGAVLAEVTLGQRTEIRNQGSNKNPASPAGSNPIPDP